MARVAVALTCTAEQRGELMALARSRTEEARLWGGASSGLGVGRRGGRGLAPVARGRGPIARAALLVRQPRPEIGAQGRRYYRPLPEPAGKRAGLERRREADDPGAGARQR